MSREPIKPAVVVTGGGQGIGRATAELFRQEGRWQVVAVDIDQEALDELDPEIWTYRLDVADGSAVDEFGQWLATRTEVVGVLVNNAGVGYRRPIREAERAEFERVLAVDLVAPYWMTRALLPLLERAHGAAVINIASTRALMSEPHTEAYSAAKGGILALTHALAISLAPERIRVNAISPGWILSEPWQKANRRSQPPLSEADRVQHPSGRVGVPTDIARAVRFLADPANDFINGTNLIVDGGMTVKMIYAE